MMESDQASDIDSLYLTCTMKIEKMEMSRLVIVKPSCRVPVSMPEKVRYVS
jgi:hypothetical protein